MINKLQQKKVVKRKKLKKLKSMKIKLRKVIKLDGAISKLPFLSCTF
jgi:hypothetical protein